MSLLSKLKEAVIEEDAPAVAPHVANQPYVAPQSGSYPSTGTATAPIQTSDNDMRLRVAGAGPSTVFAATLKSLASYIPDEASRFKAAKDMLAAQGVTVAAISADMTTIVGRLANECTHFEAAKAAKQSSDVTTKEARLAEIDNQMNQLKTERDSVAVALVTTKQLIEKKEQEFYASANSLKAEYESNIAKVKNYLGAI